MCSDEMKMMRNVKAIEKETPWKAACCIFLLKLIFQKLESKDGAVTCLLNPRHSFALFFFLFFLTIPNFNGSNIQHSTTNLASDGVQKVFRIIQVFAQLHPSDTSAWLHKTRSHIKIYSTSWREVTATSHQSSAATGVFQELLGYICLENTSYTCQMSHQKCHLKQANV